MNLILAFLASLSLFTIIITLQHIVLYLYDPKGLRKYPGLNSLCGITNLGYIYELWQSDGFRSRAITKTHRKHPIIRLGPNALSFASTGAIKDIYGHSTTCMKGDMYSTTAGPHRSLLDSVDKQEHAEKRRRLAAAFATKHLQGWEHKVVDKCRRLIDQFDQQCMPQRTHSTGFIKRTESSTIDFRKWSNLFTVEAIADIALSENLGLLEAGNDQVTEVDVAGQTQRVSFIRALHSGGRVAAPIVWSTSAYAYLKHVAEVLSPSYRREVSLNTCYDGVIRYLVSRRLQRQLAGESLDDFFTCLVEDRQGKPTGLTVDEMAAEVNVFMNAGSDTTAIQLTHVMYYLLKNPEKLRRLRQEVDRVVADETEIPAFASVRDIPYLRACLDESLRLSPPVSFGLQRKTPAEGASIDGIWVAGGTLVSVPAYVVHRDAAVFPNPEAFVPERWLSDEAKELQKFFLPFSTGARGCIGRNISYIEQHVLLATLVKRYDFALPHPNWELSWEERFNLWPASMPLSISRRT